MHEHDRPHVACGGRRPGMWRLGFDSDFPEAHRGIHSNPLMEKSEAATNQLISGVDAIRAPGNQGPAACPLFRDLLNWPPLHYLSVPQLR